MAHWKNRKPRRFTGCCQMCAHRDHDGGLRNKRIPTLGELRCQPASDGVEEYVEEREDLMYPSSYTCDPCDCGDVACRGEPRECVERFLGLWPDTFVERQPTAPASLGTIADVMR